MQTGTVPRTPSIAREIADLDRLQSLQSCPTVVSRTTLAWFVLHTHQPQLIVAIAGCGIEEPPRAEADE